MVIVNEETYDAVGESIESLLGGLGYNIGRCTVEYNGKILSIGDMGKLLEDGDCLVVVRYGCCCSGD